MSPISTSPMTIHLPLHVSQPNPGQGICCKRCTHYDNDAHQQGHPYPCDMVRWIDPSETPGMAGPTGSKHFKPDLQRYKVANDEGIALESCSSYLKHKDTTFDPPNFLPTEGNLHPAVDLIG